MIPLKVQIVSVTKEHFFNKSNILKRGIVANIYFPFNNIRIGYFEHYVSLILSLLSINGTIFQCWEDVLSNNAVVNYLVKYY